ncbi:hypothetical protein RRG08_066550, partial [Elysia crispata]
MSAAHNRDDKKPKKSDRKWQISNGVIVLVVFCLLATINVLDNQPRKSQLPLASMKFKHGSTFSASLQRIQYVAVCGEKKLKCSY